MIATKYDNAYKIEKVDGTYEVNYRGCKISGDDMQTLVTMLRDCGFSVYTEEGDVYGRK